MCFPALGDTPMVKRPMYVKPFLDTYHISCLLDSQEWVPNGKEPYMNRAIIQVLKDAFFSQSNNLGTDYIGQFPVENDKCQIPIPLLALAATSVRAISR
jgi:hypothetical protein